MNRFLILTVLLILSSEIGFSQHDPQRNAAQGIASSDFKKVEKELKKANQDDPETMFVRMMLALKKGDTELAVKHAQNALDARLPFARLVAGPRLRECFSFLPIATAQICEPPTVKRVTRFMSLKAHV